jgi:hypothetical protein
VILRGERGAVVRRFSADTRLNGRSFRDVPLAPGDRLSLGPIELEVVATTTAQTEDHRPLVDFTDASAPETEHWRKAAENQRRAARLTRRRAKSLLSELRDVRRQRERLAAECREVAGQARQNAASLEGFRIQQHADRARFASQEETLQQAIENLRTENQQLQDAVELASQTQAQENDARHDGQELAQLEAELQQRQEELQSQADELEQSRQEFTQLQQELATAEELLTRQQEDLHAKASELDERAQKLEAEAQSLSEARAAADENVLVEQAQFAQQAAELEQAQAALAQQRAELEDSRETLAKQDDSGVQSQHAIQERQTELDQQAARLDQRASQLAERESELQQAQEELDRERADWTNAHQEAQSQLYSERDALEQQRVELDRQLGEAAEAAEAHAALNEQRREVEHQEKAWREERDRLQVELVNASEQLEALLSERSDWAAAQTQLKEEQQQAASRIDELQDELTQQQAECEALRSAREPSSESRVDSPNSDTPLDESPSFEQPTSEAPADSSDLLARLREEALQNDEIWPHDDNASRAKSDTLDVAIRDSGAASPVSVDVASEDEESIEDYMTKLMQRVSGHHESRANATAKSAKAEPAKPAPVAPQPSPAVAPPSRPEPSEPFQMAAPRKTPVELTSNLAAMRELANSSARSAIDTSVQQRWSQAALGKISVAILALVSSALLLYWTPGWADITFLGASLAMVISVFWTLQSVILYGNVRTARKATANQAKGDAQAGGKESIYATTPLDEAAEHATKSDVATSGAAF